MHVSFRPWGGLGQAGKGANDARETSAAGVFRLVKGNCHGALWPKGP